MGRRREDELKHYMTAKGKWPAMSPQNYLLAPAAHGALLWCHGFHQLLHQVWLSQVIMPGIVIISKAGLLRTTCYWVLSSCRYGLVVWRATTRVLGSGTFVLLDFDEGEQCWMEIIAHDLDAWYGWEVDALPRGVARKEYGSAIDGLPSDQSLVVMALVQETPVPVVQLSARKDVRQRPLKKCERR